MDINARSPIIKKYTNSFIVINNNSVYFMDINFDKFTKADKLKILSKIKIPSQIIQAEY